MSPSARPRPGSIADRLAGLAAAAAVAAAWVLIIAALVWLVGSGACCT
jgi:hypothetical protein